MNKFYVSLLVLFLALAFVCEVEGVSLTAVEVKQVNGLSVYLDKKPVGKALTNCRQMAKNSNVVLKGLACVILYKHYRGVYEQLSATNLSMSQKRASFDQDKKVMVRIENLTRLLGSFSGLLEQLKDERVKKLFLFYHFRHKNVFLLGKYKEELNLAEFYRLAFLSGVFQGKDENIVDRLVKQAD